MWGLRRDERMFEMPQRHMPLKEWPLRAPHQILMAMVNHLAVRYKVLGLSMGLFSGSSYLDVWFHL